jgi:hypothetical protein
MILASETNGMAHHYAVSDALSPADPSGEVAADPSGEATNFF